MTNDIKSLLIDAAKAAGIELRWIPRLDDYGDELPFASPNWNPLTDDGDSARLRTALEISVNWWEECVIASVQLPTVVVDAVGKYVDHNGDKNAALRMATLRLAAEIWRARK